MDGFQAFKIINAFNPDLPIIAQTAHSSIEDKENILEIKIKSALLRNDFRMKKTFFLKKFQEEFGVEKFNDLYVL